MRWMVICLLVSLVALLAAAAGVAFHIWRQHRLRGGAQTAGPGHVIGQPVETAAETDLDIEP
jgi:uncharacterized membrane protein